MIARFVFRHRAAREEEVTERHISVMRYLPCVLDRSLNQFDNGLVHFEYEPGLGGAADLTPALSLGVQGAISYCARSVIDADHAMYDDVLTIDLDTEFEDYCQFLRVGFSEVVVAFHAYRASVVLDEDLDLVDFDSITVLAATSGLDVDGRDGVFRIQPVCFFDRDLCRRAFALSPEAVRERLKNHVQSARIIDDGVCLVVTDELVIGDRLIALSDRVRALLMNGVIGE